MNTITIKDKTSFINLLKWRDLNKDLVRQAPVPIVGGEVLKTGSIMVMSGHQKLTFYRVDNTVSIRYFILDKLHVTFKYDFDSWVMKDRVVVLPFDYDNDEALQDVLTTYATTMAFMAFNPDMVIQDGVEFELNL